MINSDWSYEALFAKAQIYMDRAITADRNSTLFPFWSSLALEFVGRATLSKIHPSLIADPREGQNILHAFGYSAGKELPKTIGAKTVFLRLQIIVPAFSQADEKFCQSLINMRNEELHTGTPIFEGYSTNAWLTKYYKSIKALLEFQEKNLSDLLGTTEAVIAEEMIADYKEDLVNKVKERIKKYSDVFKEMEEDEQNAKIEQAKSTIRQLYIPYIHPHHKTAICPSCKSEALLSGKSISHSEPRLSNDVVIISNNILPIGLQCYVCGLKLRGNGELSVADLGGQFARDIPFDPIVYYAPKSNDEDDEDDSDEFDEFDDMNDEPDFDYGND